MADVAQMRFRSVSAPDQYGILALSDDGHFRVVPSDEFRDEIARLEEVALGRSQKFGIRTGIALVILGTLAVGAGWFFGRVFGKLGSRLSAPRPVGDVAVTYSKGGGIKVSLRGVQNRLQSVQMVWNADEFLQPEADAFIAKLEEMKNTNLTQE